jgi:hypothetical protein
VLDRTDVRRARRTMGPSTLSRIKVARGLRALVGMLLVVAASLLGAQGACASVWKLHKLKLPHAAFNGISCRSKSFCIAVGYVHIGSGRIKQTTLAELWDGSRWSVLATPNPAATRSNELLGISCTSRVACVAVGDSQHSGGSRSFTLAERWDGLRWSIQRTRDPERVDQLSGVSCPSSRRCIAVGTAGAELTHGLLERWNGSRWSMQHTPRLTDPNPGMNGVSGGGACAPNACTTLSGVSCVSSRSCTAVGEGYDGLIADDITWVAHWNGVAWSTQPTPLGTPGGGEDDHLNAVSCPALQACIAVGVSNFEGGGGAAGLAARRIGGIWSDISSAVVYKHDELDAVSCTSVSACTAIGVGENQTANVEHWNGSTWSFEPTPKASSTDPVAVACTSRTFCIAVGSFQEATTYVPLVEVRR